MKFWENFTYRIRIDNVYFYDEQIYKTCYVTSVNNETKTFEMKTEEQVKEQGLKFKIFKLGQAVDLMNAMFCNGYLSSIEPYFEEV